MQMKKLYMELTSVVIENRSLAENNPLNLLKKSDICKDILNNRGEEYFIHIVEQILDENE